MKILLVHPAVSPRVSFQDFMLAPPLPLEILAACLPDHDVRIVDLRCDGVLTEELESFQPDVVGVTCITPEVYAAMDVMREAKAYNERILTVVGGIHASLVPEDFQKEFADVIVLGEGETPLPEILMCHEKTESFERVHGIRYREKDDWFETPPREISTNIDGIPIAARQLTRRYSKNYFSMTANPVAALMTSRGCPFNCKFCSVWKLFSRRCLYMSAHRILKELKTIETDYVVVCDDNFIQNSQRSLELYEMIKSEDIRKNYFVQARSDTIAQHPLVVEKWREIGVDEVLVGFESSNEDELAGMSKGGSAEHHQEAMRILDANGVKVLAAFIIDPQYEASDFLRLFEYIEHMQLLFPNVTIYPRLSVLTPLPGTDLYSERHRELITRDLRLYDTLHAVLPTKLPREEFYRLFAWAWKKSVGVMVKSLMKREQEHFLEHDAMDPALVHRLLRGAKMLSKQKSYLADEEYSRGISNPSSANQGEDR